MNKWNWRSFSLLEFINLISAASKFLRNEKKIDLGTVTRFLKAVPAFCGMFGALTVGFSLPFSAPTAFFIAFATIFLIHLAEFEGIRIQYNKDKNKSLLFKNVAVKIFECAIAVTMDMGVILGLGILDTNAKPLFYAMIASLCSLSMKVYDGTKAVLNYCRPTTEYDLEAQEFVPVRSRCTIL